MLINNIVSFEQMGPGDQLLSSNKSIKYQSPSSNTFKDTGT